ncbi:hypothetical protein G210_1595 [Candida maltosa Xu316]|uniref:Uncharacterized protein n=1 Tax=Candida maltosa (strain Xu316) TaxID=1245528 RepID=M3HKL0_CANMX|nr:hypothetical protein G210_1595 [Candida maltosa Xu316]
MSRRAEIKRKEEIQAKFQLSLSNINQQSLNWLLPAKKEGATEVKNDDDSFMNLQIIPQGSSLCSKGDFQKIGDFLNSKDISKSKKQLQSKPVNKPMMALMNKMRDSNRKNIQKNHKINKPNRVERKVVPQNNDDDDDSDEEVDSRSRNAKKGAGLSFGRPKK